MLKSIFLVLTAAAVGTTGCAEKDSGTFRVEILPSIATRVTGVHFDAGDQIGLTIMKGSTPYVENRMMTYDGSAFTAEGLLWYNDLNEKSVLTAYYPYASSGAPGEFAVATNQMTGYGASDLLGACKADVKPGAAPVGMRFRHLLSEMRIVVTNSSDAAVTGITVTGSVPAADVDLSSLSVRVRTGAQAESVRVNEVTADVAYRVILVPQTAVLTITVQTADGKSRSKQLAEALLESGKRYDVAVKVTNIDISVSLSGDVEDWVDGGSLDGDSNPDSNPDPAPTPDPGETLEYGGEIYRTRTIDGCVWLADNLRHQPSGVTLGAGFWYPEGGASALATQGLLYDYATATGGLSSRADGAIQGICPAGWHLPTLGEIMALMSSEYGNDFFVVAGYKPNAPTDTDRPLIAGTGYLMAAPLNADQRCDCLMYGEKSPAPTLSTRLATNGISVRCVKSQ